MTPELFGELLARNEGESLDFKRAAYAFDGDERERKRAEFAKDVLCMFNTPRDETAYIIIGVEKQRDGDTVLHGISQHPDDADLQAKVEAIVHPHPSFEYEPFHYEGRQFGVFCIAPTRSFGPCVPVRDCGNTLERHRVYLRRGSQNAVANAEEQRRIYQWFQLSPRSPSKAPTGDATWDALVTAVHAFEPGYHYVLVASRLERALVDRLEHIGLVGWSLVLDFDADSDVSGLLSASRAKLESRRALHVVTRGGRPVMNPSHGTYWYFARGLRGRESLLSLGKHRDWLTSYGDDTREQLRQLARYGEIKPVVILAIWNERELRRHLTSVFEAAASIFGDSARFVVATPDPIEEYSALETDFDALLCHIPIHQLSHGLASLLSLEVQDQGIAIPSASGAPVVVEAADYAQLTEHCELVHLSLGLRPPEGRVPESDFLRGHEITWHDLGLHVDVDRDVHLPLERAVRQDLETRATVRLNLFHAPGAGGTTLARRLLWNLHREYPAVLLRRCIPEETIERLARLTTTTGKPVLVVAEASAIGETQLEQLYRLLRARHVPGVIVQVARRTRAPESVRRGERSFFLAEGLSNAESSTFVHYLKRIAPSRATYLEQSLGSTDARERTPFYLALVAFERDFIGLDRYVTARCQSLTDSQRLVLIALALAHYYAQRAVPAQLFCSALGAAHSRPLDLHKILPSDSLDLLVEDEPGLWRPRHQLISETALRHLLAPLGGDMRLWKQGLSARAKQLIDLCAYAGVAISEDSLDIVKRVFVLRDSREDLGTERAGVPVFTQIVEDIPSDAGRLEVLRYLTESVPGEPHFWAHLGRYLSYRMRDFPESLRAIDQGLTLAPQDHVLHHMRGMALRSMAYNAMEAGQGIGEVAKIAQEASESFASARIIAPDDEHGYISEAQLIIRVLEYARAKGPGIIPAVASAQAAPWLRESLQAVEDLLAQVRHNREGDASSEYEERCRADLENVYGQHDVALQSFQNLLDRKDIYAPPIRRQIAWTYLARQGRDWSKLPHREVQRIVDLLEKNLQEEPGETRNLRLWMRAIRGLPGPPSLERVLEQVTYWNAASGSLESLYYLYVLHMLRSLQGLTLARDYAERALKTCRERSSYLRNRTRSFEWVGIGDSISKLVHQDALGAWDDASAFYSNTTLLWRVPAVIARIDRPEKGELELPGGMRSFFVPAVSTHTRGRDENRRVTCYIGFSYDGPRAWGVASAE